MNLKQIQRNAAFLIGHHRVQLSHYAHLGCIDTESITVLTTLAELGLLDPKETRAFLEKNQEIASRCRES